MHLKLCTLKKGFIQMLIIINEQKFLVRSYAFGDFQYVTILQTDIQSRRKWSECEVSPLHELGRFWTVKLSGGLQQ